ncbi:MAG: 16S rRNA (uracil(1498)-N(3))-methyltransferase [Ruminococcaceae bacterium]|nr:16S rRNA (uracil(1498)-N(3))-methyltransferase [Oscillospiraceae bacterium]
MPRFFIRRSQIYNDTVLLCGDDAHHIARSLRMAVGDKITVCDMQGNEYDCAITEFNENKEVRAKIESIKSPENEPPVRIRLFQALPKGDKLDTVIQKAVECGASEIIPFESERCVVRMKPEAEQRKTERRKRIAEEAAKQCGRSLLPEVRETVDFARMLDMIKNDGLCLFCYEGDGTEPLGKVLARESERLLGEEGSSISVIIGSEGGFSLAEAERIKNAGAVPVGLGKRILRTETASGFILACLVYACELQ